MPAPSAPSNTAKGTIYYDLTPTDDSAPLSGYEGVAYLVGLDGYMGAFTLNSGLGIAIRQVFISDTAGRITMELYGNDQIVPAGSYWQVTQKEGRVAKAIELAATQVINARDVVDNDFPTGGSFTPPRLFFTTSIVRAATTANITIATALNNGDTLDGLTLATGDRVLVKDQSAPATNGVWVVGASPARATDFDTWAEFPGVAISVTAGTVNAGTIWRCTVASGGTLETTAITFTSFGGNTANSLVLGTSTITGGTTGRVLYDAGGVVGELVSSTVGKAILASTNPSAITFGRANADNTFDWLSAGSFVTAIGAQVATVAVTDVLPYLLFANSHERHNLYALISSDGKNYNILGNQPLFTSSGDTADAAPYFQSSTGTFFIAFTTAGTTAGSGAAKKSFSIISSRDLRTWSSATIIDLSSVATGSTAVVWSPFPTEDTDGTLYNFVTVSIDNLATYTTYWATASNAALSAWSAWTAISVGGLSVIDSSIIKIGSTYYHWFTRASTSYAGYATSTSMTGTRTVVVSGAADTLGFGVGLENIQVVPTATGYRLFGDAVDGRGTCYSDSTNGTSGWSALVFVTTPLMYGPTGDLAPSAAGVLRIDSLNKQLVAFAAQHSANPPWSSYCTPGTVFVTAEGNLIPFAYTPMGAVMGQQQTPLGTLTISESEYSGAINEPSVVFKAFNVGATLSQYWSTRVQLPGVGTAFVLNYNGTDQVVIRGDTGNINAPTMSATTFTGALVGNATTATAWATGRTISITGDLTYTSASLTGAANVTAAGTLATVNSNVGSFGSATTSLTLTANGKGLITAVSSQTVTPAVGSITGLGTGVATALAINTGSAGAPVLFNGAGGTPSSMVGTNITGTASGLTAGTASAVAVGGITGLGTGVATALAVNVGSAGAFITFNGALGTPSSGTATNLTGLPVSTGISGLGASVATFLATPSSANLAAAVTDEVGSGKVVFAAGVSNGGNGSADSGKVVSFSSVGSFDATVAVSIWGDTSVNPGALALYNIANTASVAIVPGTPSTNRILTAPNLSGVLATIDGGQTFTSAVWNAGAVTSSGAGSFTTLTATATASLTVGTAGSTVGQVLFKNATSGTATLAPPAGALGTYTVTLPNAASTLPIYGAQITYTGPSTARTVTYPDASFTVARTDAANTFTGVQSMTSPDITTGITSPSTTFAVFNATPTTINAFGAATTISMGAATGTMTVSNTTLATKEVTFTTDLKSTTALATPSALSATQATMFASTVNGCANIGYGTTYDWSAMNRAGTVCIGVGPNTTVVNMPGNVTSSSTTTGTLVVTGGIGASGAINAQALTISGNAIIGSGGYFQWSTSRSAMFSDSDGTIKLTNSGAASFTRLVFGPATTSGAALNISTTGITAALGDGSAGGSLTASGTLAVTGVGTFTAQSVHNGGAKIGSAGIAITNIRFGISGAMVLGAVTITDTGATASTRYFFAAAALGTVSIAGGYYASSRSAGASLVCTSSQPTETSTVFWLGFEP